MNPNKKTALLAGALFLIAMVTSLVGGGLIESALGTRDSLETISVNTSPVLFGVFLEFINGIAVVGIATMLFPILKRYNESAALGYVGFRIIECVFCIVSATIPLLLITASTEYLKAGALDFQTLGTLFLAARTTSTGLLIPVFFSLGALLFYSVLYQSKLLPRWISMWGIVGVALVLALNLLDIDVSAGLVLALPIILNEIFLGIWLIVKGFNSSPSAPESARQLQTELG